MNCDYNYAELIADETWLSIFQYLNAKDLCSVSSVSKRMQSIAKDESLWKKLSFEEYPQSSANFKEKNISQVKSKKRKLNSPDLWRNFFRRQTKFYSAAYQDKLERTHLIDDSPVDSLSFLGDNICVGSSTEEVFFGNCEKFSKKIQWVSCVKIDMNRDGGIIIYTGHRDKMIRIWNEAFEPLGTLIEHEDQVEALEINNQHLISASLDGKICVWDTSETKCLKVLKHPDSPSSYTSLTCNANKLVASSPGGKIDVWDNNSYDYLASFKEKRYSIMCIKAWQNTLFCATNKGYVSIWNLDSLRFINRIEHLGQIGQFEIYDDRIFYVQEENNSSVKHLSICNARTLKVESKNTMDVNADHIGCIRVNALGIFCTVNRSKMKEGLLHFFLSDEIIFEN